MSGNMQLNGVGQLHGVTVSETSGEGQSQVFGEAPALYDRFRPSYPRDLMEAIIADTGSRPVLEIGAGTGKATKALLALGKRVHAIEPDPRMAAVLELNCRRSGVEVQHATFETAELPPEVYDLVISAQAWQWVDPAVGYDRVAATLIPHGRFALMWHHPLRRQGLFGEALAQLYTRLVPGIRYPLPGSVTADFDPAREPVAATSLFKSWNKLEHHWQRQLDAAGLVGWLCSSSRHRMLPLDTRAEVLAAVTALVEEFGGAVTVDMATVAHLAYRS